MKPSSFRNLDRRTFLATTGTALGGLLAATLPPFPVQAVTGGAAIPPHRGSRWFENAWRRAVIDMHIPDWDPKFLSEFDADRYVEALVRSRAQSIVCYAHSHVGLFNYPTKIGKQHAGLKGRDIVAEMINAVIGAASPSCFTSA
jgi:hypothetical protein